LGVKLIPQSLDPKVWTRGLRVPGDTWYSDSPLLDLQLRLVQSAPAAPEAGLGASLVVENCRACLSKQARLDSGVWFA
jgi:hypothetical protein